MAGKIDDGGAAFPQLKNTGLARLDPDGGAQMDKECTGGMTLRDWFAGQALVGILANPDISSSAARCDVSTEEFREDTARAAFAAADAMIAARKDNRHA